MNCPSCGSRDIIKNGTLTLSNSVRRQRYRCKDCGNTCFDNNNNVVITSAQSTHYANEMSEIATVYASGAKKSSCVLVIPRRLARKYSISAGDKVLCKEGENGILIRKLEVGA